VNDPPVANDDVYSTDEDTELNVGAPGVLDNDSDPEGEAITAIKVSDPSHGTLTLNGDGSFIYMPDAGFSGSDSFTYKANDGDLDSNIATVSITVEITEIIPATVDFAPHVLNLKSKGKYVTVRIELPMGYDVSQIDIASIRLNDTVPAIGRPPEVGDYYGDSIPDLIVKFDRAAVQALVEAGKSVEIIVTGQIDGMQFKGTDTIRVMNPGRH
jgi:hypothetical protein